MTKNCVYCKENILDNRALDVCDKCGVGVWGTKMFKAILNNMQDAQDKGDLRNASSGSDFPKDPRFKA
jgi:uncharacterized UBP type Zn finger protein